MDSNNEPASPRIMDVALEFVGPTSSSSSSSAMPSIKKLAKSATLVRFIVQQLSSVVITGEVANHVIVQLWDELERLPVPGRLAKIHVAHVQFTEAGATAWHAFLASHATSIRHVVLNQLLPPPQTTTSSSSSPNSKPSKKSSSSSKKSSKSKKKKLSKSSSSAQPQSSEDTETNDNGPQEAGGSPQQEEEEDNEEEEEDNQKDEDDNDDSATKKKASPQQQQQDNDDDDNDSEEDHVRRWAHILTAFEQSPLTVLDMSRNTLHGATLWNVWKQQQDFQQRLQQSSDTTSSISSSTTRTQLRQLILDSVDLNADSWKALSTTFVWSGLEDLHIVLDEPIPSEEAALEAAQQIVRQATKLSSLRWIQKQGSDQPLPWTGLRDMAVARAAAAAAQPSTTTSTTTAAPQSPHSTSNNNNNNNGSSAAGGDPSSHSNKSSSSSSLPQLKHLVLEGPGTPDFCTARDLQELTATLKELPRLKTLKLRHLGLTDVTSICSALRASRPPLEVLDLSYNELSSTGCRRLVDLKRVSRISQSLALLVVNDNRVETAAARELWETFGTTITLDNNPGIDCGQIIADLMSNQAQLEREREELRAQFMERNSNNNTNNNATTANTSNNTTAAAVSAAAELAESMRKENRRLREERDLLAKAFSIMGISQQVDEHKRLLDRVQRLEDVMVLGASSSKRSMGSGGSGHSSAGGSHHGGSNSNVGSLDALLSGGGKTSSRRRIHVNELPLDRLTAAAAAAAAAAGRIPSARSVGSLNRSHSGRSTASRGFADLDEASRAVTADSSSSPHHSQHHHPHHHHPHSSSSHSRKQQQTSSSSSVRGRSSYHARGTPTSPGARSVASTGGSSSLQHAMMDSTIVATAERSDAAPQQQRRSSNLRHSSYTTPSSSSSVGGGGGGSRRASTRHLSSLDME